MATVAPNTPSSPTPQGGPGVATNVPEARRRSGSFTNLQTYLRANRDSTQEAADRVARDIEERGQQAVKDIESQRDQTIGQVQGIGADLQEDTIRSQIQELAPVQQNNVNFQNAATFSDPTLDPSRVEQTQQTLQQLRDANPASVQYDFTDPITRARAAERDAEMLGSTQGIQSLIKRQSSSPGTRGGNRLDTLLLESIPESRQRFAGVQQNVIGAIDPVAEQASQQVRSAIDENQARINSLRQIADQELANQIAAGYNIANERRAGVQSQLDQRLDQLGSTYDSVYDATLGQFVPQNLTSVIGNVNRDQLLGAAGYKTADQLIREAAANPQAVSQQLTTEQLLDPDTAARLNALYNLRGELGVVEGDEFSPKQYEAQGIGNVDDLLFQGRLPNITADVETGIRNSTSQFKTSVGEAYNSYKNNSVANQPAINAALEDFTKIGYVDKANRRNAIRSDINQLGAAMPAINQQLRRFGFNELGNIDTALRTFGYTGPQVNDQNIETMLRSPANANQSSNLFTSLSNLKNAISSEIAGGQAVNMGGGIFIPNQPSGDPITSTVGTGVFRTVG